MGEGIVTPEYFLYHLRLSEAFDILKGMDEKESRMVHTTYSAHRFTAGIVYKVLTGSTLSLPFPWEDDEEVTDEDMNEDEVEEMRNRLKALNDGKNQRQGNDSSSR